MCCWGNGSCGWISLPISQREEGPSWTEPQNLRHSQLAHFAGKGTASGKETSGTVPECIPEDGGRAAERLRERSALARELGIHQRLLYKWRDHLEPIDDGEAPPENGKERELRLQVAQLKRLVADKTLEADFFKGALQKVEARRQSNSPAGETASTTKSGS